MEIVKEKNLATFGRINKGCKKMYPDGVDKAFHFPEIVSRLTVNLKTFSLHYPRYPTLAIDMIQTSLCHALQHYMTGAN